MLQYDKKKVSILLALLLIAALLAHEYWARNKTVNSSRIMADVEGREITVDDFKEAANLSLSNKYASVDSLKTRFEILDSLITKKLLVLEAQSKDFDKDTAFLKEMQHYWEQALIKRVLKEKMFEIAKYAHVRDKEVLKEYSGMQRKILAQTVILYNKKAAEEISGAGDSFDETKAKHEESIVLDEPQRWYLYGDLPRRVEDVVFALKQGQISAPISYGSNWMVVRMLGEEKIAVEPLEKLAPSIRRNIFKRKQEEWIEKWMATLRNNARVTINVKNLKKIKVK